MQGSTYSALLAHAAACRSRIESAARGLVAKIPAESSTLTPTDAACLAVLRHPPSAARDALRLTPEGQALLSGASPAAPSEGELRDAAARIDELDELQLQSLAVLVLDGLRHWRTFNMLSGDVQAAMEDELLPMDARGSAAALFMRGESAAEELLGLAGLLGGQSPDEIQEQIDAIARAAVQYRNV